MKNLSDLLLKFKSIEDPSNKKNNIQIIIEELTHIKLPEKSISIEKGKLTLKLHPVQKNVVFMHKEKILEEILKKLPDGHIKQIVFI